MKKKTNTTLCATINTTNDFKVSINHYGMTPKKTIPIIALLGYLDMVQDNLGWSDTSYNGRSPKCLVYDFACYKDKNKIVQHFINNATIKAGLRNENVEFIADLCCYTHCVGALMSNDIQDAMWSVFNAIKLYIDKNWSKSNAIAFFQNID